MQAVLTSLNLWLEKQGEGLGLALQERLEGVLKEAVVRMAKVEATPAKTGRLGRPAMKLATCVVDVICSANSYDTDPPVQPGRTPARLANLVTFLKTPQIEMVLDPEDQVDQLVGDEGGLGARLADAGIGPGTPVARHPNYPRFRSGAQFNEGSPALANSQEKKGGGGLRTMGRTLVAASGPETPDTSDQAVEDILREVRNAAAEEESGDLMEEEEKPKKRPTKRCLIATKDIDAAARERMGLGAAKRKNEDEGGREKKKKEPAAKKKMFSTPKGQKKMTSFFMR